MKFPGNNKIELNMAATKALIAEHLSTTFASGAPVRITRVDISGSYSAKTLDIEFTTDPEEATPAGESTADF